MITLSRASVRRALLVHSVCVAALFWTPGLAVAEPSSGGDSSVYQPRSLPSKIEGRAIPIPAARDRIPARHSEEAEFSGTSATPAGLWKILEYYELGDLDAALVAWETSELPSDTRIWRLLSIAATYLELGQIDRAKTPLLEARQLAPDNAVLHFVQAKLRLQQADRAAEWNDAVLLTGNRLIGVAATPIVHRPKSWYQRSAADELELAVELAPHLDRYQPLLPTYDVVRVPYPVPVPDTPPLVDDLLIALRLDDFLLEAHKMLASYFTVHGCAELAEEHLDEAHHLGADVARQYQVVGQLYEEQGRNAEAHRVHLKAMAHEPFVRLPESS